MFRQLLAGFTELLYAALGASVLSVGWGLSVGGVAFGKYVVRWVWEGAVIAVNVRRSLLHIIVF